MNFIKTARLLLGLLWIIGFTACTSVSTNTGETLTMIGFSELELDGANLAVTINFTGKKSEKTSFITLVKSGALAQFDPKLQYENMYQEGEESPREFTYSISYLLVLKDAASLDIVLKALEKENLSVYLNTVGSYIYPQSREELLEKLFDGAFDNAVKRISEHAKAKGKNFKITAVADADDTFGSVIPLDGIAYQNKLYKKVQVTAELH
jgi:hypothetical protein